MPDEPNRTVDFVEMIRNGIVITFDDGKCAFFPADLLYRQLPEAEELRETDDDE